jgi:orotate phosphoribosyltransferase
LKRKELQKKWLPKLKEIGAVWEHDGDPARPYALLTSGKISNGFIDLSKLIQRPALLSEAVEDLLKLFSPPQTITGFLGSAMGAVNISYEFATQFSSIPCFSFFSEKINGEIVIKRFDVSLHNLMVVEDVITTGQTTRKTIAAAKDDGATIMDTIAVIVNRSGSNSLDGRKISALVEVSYKSWESGNNPFFYKGGELVEPVRPKGAGWLALTKDYL